MPVFNPIIDLVRLTELGAEPITLAEAKTQLRVDFTDDNTEITELITKARKAVENYCNISIVYQRIRVVARMDTEWKLPYGPVIGIETVEDTAATQGSGPMSYETSDRDWTFDGDVFDPGGCYRMRVTYTAGNYCPADLKDAILQVLTFMYENRGKDAAVEDLEKALSNADAYRVLLWI